MSPSQGCTGAGLLNLPSAVFGFLRHTHNASMPAKTVAEPAGPPKNRFQSLAKGQPVATLSEIDAAEVARTPTGQEELDRVLGGGIVECALPLRYDSGQRATQRSNTPVTARNSAKNTNWPCGVAAAPSSQRTCVRPPIVSTACSDCWSFPATWRAASALRLASPFR